MRKSGKKGGEEPASKEIAASDADYDELDSAGKKQVENDSVGGSRRRKRRKTRKTKKRR